MESEYYYPNLEVRYVFTRAWEVFRENMGIVFGIVIVQILILGAASFIPLLPLLLAGPLSAGCYYAIVRLVRGEEVEIRDMFDGFKQFGRTFGVYFMYAIFVGIGMILLVVPGVIAAIGLMPAMYLVLDANYSVGDTLRESWEMTRGYRWSIFVIALVIGLLSIVGLIALIIGAFFVGVYGYVVMATVYDELAQAREQVEETAGETEI
jgi:uncharacterized membrane protein